MRRDAVHHVLLQPPDSEGSPMSGLRLVASYAFLLAAIIIMHCGSVLLQLQGWSSDPAGQHDCMLLYWHRLSVCGERGMQGLCEMVGRQLLYSHTVTYMQPHNSTEASEHRGLPLTATVCLQH